MDKKQVIKPIHDMIPHMLESFYVHKVILYGSWTEGSQDQDSDIDVAVIVREAPLDYLQCLIRLHEICSTFDVRLEPLLFEYGHDPSGFLEHILSQGEVLYEEGRMVNEE
jgi:predicted nucleotidyltransferase